MSVSIYEYTLTINGAVQEIAKNFSSPAEIFSLILANKALNKSWSPIFKKLCSLMKLQKAVFAPRYFPKESSAMVANMNLRVDNYVTLNEEVIGLINMDRSVHWFFAFTNFRVTNYVKNKPNIAAKDQIKFKGCWFEVIEVVYAAGALEYHVITGPVKMGKLTDFECKADAVDQCRAVYEYCNL